MWSSSEHILWPFLGGGFYKIVSAMLDSWSPDLCNKPSSGVVPTCKHLDIGQVWPGRNPGLWIGNGLKTQGTCKGSKSFCAAARVSPPKVWDWFAPEVDQADLDDNCLHVLHTRAFPFACPEQPLSIRLNAVAEVHSRLSLPTSSIITLCKPIRTKHDKTISITCEMASKPRWRYLCTSLLKFFGFSKFICTALEIGKLFRTPMERTAKSTWICMIPSVSGRLSLTVFEQAELPWLLLPELTPQDTPLVEVNAEEILYFPVTLPNNTQHTGQNSATFRKFVLMSQLFRTKPVMSIFLDNMFEPKNTYSL